MAKLSYRWRLREIMAARDLWHTSDLAPLLEVRGVHLSPAQVYRLVTQTPERLSLRTLMAVCDALSCTSTDLIEPVEDTPAVSKRRRAAGDDGDAQVRPLRPVRARVARRDPKG